MHAVSSHIYIYIIWCSQTHGESRSQPFVGGSDVQNMNFFSVSRAFSFYVNLIAIPRHAKILGYIQHTSNVAGETSKHTSLPHASFDMKISFVANVVEPWPQTVHDQDKESFEFQVVRNMKVLDSCPQSPLEANQPQTLKAFHPRPFTHTQEYSPNYEIRLPKVNVFWLIRNKSITASRYFILDLWPTPTPKKTAHLKIVVQKHNSCPGYNDTRPKNCCCCSIHIAWKTHTHTQFPRKGHGKVEKLQPHIRHQINVPITTARNFAMCQMWRPDTMMDGKSLTKNL